jgi:RNA polymerase sigma factor (sigma-70 family)
MNLPDFNLTKAISWDKLYRKQAPVLKGICRRYVGNESLAEDLVQEAFMVAFDKIGTFGNRGAIEGWIRKIAINNALQYLRNKQSTVPIETLSVPIEQEPVMENSNNTIRFAIEKASFSTHELLEVIDHLPVHHKTVFNLYVIDGYSHKQIARELSISPGTSKSHLARARKKAQELLYERAIGQPEASPRRRYLPFLFLFSPNYIDRMFRKNFSHFQLPVQPHTMTLPTAPISGLKWGASLVGKVLIGGTVLTAGIFGYRANEMQQQSSAEQSNQLPVMVLADTVAAEKPDTLVMMVDSPLCKPVIHLVKSDSTAPKTQVQIPKEPVIIRKTIVVHDTLYLEKPAEN